MRDLCQWHETPPVQVLEAPLIGPAIPDRLNPLGLPIFLGGVWSGSGDPDPLAAHFVSATKVLIPAPPPPEQPVCDLPGTWLFGGGLQDHFGHFLTESLGRLWSLDLAEQGAVNGVVWVPLFHGRVPDFVPETLAEMRGLPPAVILKDQVLRPERLLVPRQEMGAGFGLLADAGAARSLRDRFVAVDEPTPPRGAVYVTRSALSDSNPAWIAAGSGQLLPGPFLDEAFRQGGYQIFHPEKFNVAQQIRTYRNADVLVVDEGSALHLVALVARPETRIVVLCRRPWYRFLLEAHLRIYLGEEDARVVVRMVEGKTLTCGNANAVFVIPDMRRLAEILSAAGVPGIASDDIPMAQLEEALAQLRRD